MSALDRSTLSDNARMIRKLLVIVLAMFGFGYALVPIYKKLCQITGINVLALAEDKAKDKSAFNTQVDLNRTVTVELDANTQGPWRMLPTKRSVQVHPGELITVVYEVANQQARTIVGQAIPSYAPAQSAAHFNKVECFCFKQQTLGPNEVKQFAVAFTVGSQLPKDVHSITLSYTFFEVAGAAAQTAAKADGRG